MVKVVDSIPGSGKTEFAIKLMNEANINKKFIYITPFLKEVERVKKSVKKRKLFSPDVRCGSGSKYEHLKKLITSGNNIVTTHALFAKADNELLELLQYDNYTLIIDEVMNVLNHVELKKSDLQTLLDSNLIQIEEDKSITWIGDPEYSGRYDDVKDSATSNNLFVVRDTMLIWTFPVKIFKAFEEVYIMTYYFDGQLQRYYYDMYNVQYEYYSVHNGNLIPFTREYEDRNKINKLIKIYDGKLNNIGDKENSLSSSWYDKNKDSGKLKELKNHLYNYYKNITNSKVDSFMWTTFKKYKNHLHGKGFSNLFIEWNIRATNAYIKKSILAFLINRYPNPITECAFFQERNVKIDQELIALTDMLQWIYRSRIRKNQSIQIYIPSSRMRGLLQDYLNDKI